MSSSTSLDESAMTSSSGTRDVNRVLRLNPAKNLRYFGILWKQRNPDENNATSFDVKDLPIERLSSSKISTGFLTNIKQRLCAKKLRLSKVKKKSISIEPQCENHDSLRFNDEKLSFSTESHAAGSDDPVFPMSSAEDCQQNENNECSEEKKVDTRLDIDSAVEREHNEEESLRDVDSLKKVSLDVRHDDQDEKQSNFDEAERPGGTIAELTVLVETIDNIDTLENRYISNENKGKVKLSEELLNLGKYGWYWGPISGDEADLKLTSEPDGAFLVRDSSDDRYLLTLSFKASGRILHARMEHSGGLFSLCNPDENERFASVAELIDHSMNYSESAVYCYSRPKYPGYPSFPVRLTKPVSRFTQVRSLQYLCRFVIRQNTTLDNIHKLPLPKIIRGYVEEAHF